jgi:murein DD-endopeptidase MepM/ murein hydrolase activator NlpD
VRRRSRACGLALYAIALVVAAGSLPEVAAAHGRKARVTQTTPGDPPRPPRAKPVFAGRPAARKPVGAGLYTIGRGDTLYRIALRFGVPLARLVSINGLRAPYALKIGQRLRLPAAATSPRAPRPAAAKRAAPARPSYHVVKRGETLYRISRKYGVGLQTLRRLNGIAPPFRLAVGQRIVLSAPQTVPQTVPQTARRAPRRGVPTPDELRLAFFSTDDGGAAGASAGKRQSALPAKKPPVPLSEPDPPPRSRGTFLWPVGGRLIAGFGPRKGGERNDGINIGAPRGTSVLAAENGVVAYVGNEVRGFGKLVLIRHAEEWVTAYAHNDEVLVTRGEKVRRGQAIARLGSSGSVSRPQLHFEIRKGTRAVDPLRMLGRRQQAGGRARVDGS